MQGVFIEDRRPKSKKEVKEAVAEGKHVQLEATSIFGNEYGGNVRNAPDGEYHFVGPDPHTKRNFYGTIAKRGDQIKVS